MILTCLRHQEEFYLNSTKRAGWWEEDIASQKGEKRRNIWKISVLWSFPETDLTTKRVTGCTLPKIAVNCEVCPATHTELLGCIPSLCNFRLMEETWRSFWTQRKAPLPVRSDLSCLIQGIILEASPPHPTHAICPCPPPWQPRLPQMSARSPAGSHQGCELHKDSSHSSITGVRCNTFSRWWLRRFTQPKVQAPSATGRTHFYLLPSESAPVRMIYEMSSCKSNYVQTT